jgi:hypothetical protein
VLVLVRIYETRHRDISLKIAESTNSQTPIHSRDLRANDTIQKKLQQALGDLGYCYERKANEYRDQEARVRIDSFAAGQAFAAYHLGLPEVSYKDKARIFGDLYEDVFSDDTTAEQILSAWRVLAEVRKEKRAFESLLRAGEEIDLEGFAIIAGSFHVVHAVRLLCVHQGVDANDLTHASGQVSDACQMVQEVARAAYARSSEGDKPFDISRFFKDAETKTLIQAAVPEFLEAERQLRLPDGRG